MKGESYPRSFEELVGRAIIDVEFRQMLIDPERQPEALRMVGLEPTPEIVRELNHSIHAIEHLAQQFGGPKAAS